MAGSLSEWGPRCLWMTHGARFRGASTSPPPPPTKPWSESPWADGGAITEPWGDTAGLWLLFSHSVLEFCHMNLLMLSPAPTLIVTTKSHTSLLLPFSYKLLFGRSSIHWELKDPTEQPHVRLVDPVPVIGTGLTLWWTFHHHPEPRVERW